MARSAFHVGRLEPVPGWYFGLRFNHHLLGDMCQCTYVDGRYEPNEMFEMSTLIG